MKKKQRSKDTGRFVTDRSESFDVLLALRITSSMKATLDNLSDRNQFVRDAIAEKLKREEIV